MYFPTSFVLAVIPLFVRSAVAQADSLTLDPKVVAPNFALDGQAVPTAGQVASDTSTNNFINFCALHADLAITNGAQVAEGSCNPIPMGQIPAKENMPSGKFQNPKNGDKIGVNKPFTIALKINNFVPGNFVNATSNYFAAPQQLQGKVIMGHSHVVIESLANFAAVTPLDPTKFAFFKGLNAAANAAGALTADVPGLPAGFYRLSTITTAANHQPALLPVAQHGSVDDVVYFQVADGAAAAKVRREVYARSGPSGRAPRARLARELY